jgi:hypothetical protein
MDPNRTFSHQLREQIRESGETPYAIAKRAGIGRDIVSRFMSAERGLTSESLDKLWIALRLRITLAPGRRPGRPGAIERTTNARTDAAAAAEGTHGNDPAAT